MAVIRVLVLGDSPIFVRGIVSVIELTEQADVVETARPRDGVGALVAAHRPSVVVVVEENGTDLTDVVQAAGAVPVLVVGRSNLADIAGAIRARASGYVGRDEPGEYLVSTLLAVASGRSVYPSGWQEALAAPAGRRGRVNVELTPREHDILRLVIEGSSNKEIARSLGLAQQTVKNHLGHMMLKIGVSSRLQLYRWAIDAGVGGGAAGEDAVIDVRDRAPAHDRDV